MTTRRITTEYLDNLKLDLDLARIKTQHQTNTPDQKAIEEREKYKNEMYAVNGTYYYDREQQNVDFEKLKEVYRKNVSNFQILNSSLKEIIYRWPERKDSIQKIIKQETEKMEIGGNNCYGHKLYRMIMDGKTFNKQQQDNLYFRELDLPKRYKTKEDIDNDPLWAFPFPTRKLTP